MSADDVLHPGRRSIRLKSRDYSAPGAYFLTICTHNRRYLFSKVTDLGMELTALGHIVYENWIGLPSHFTHVNLHAFVVMPNHVHGLIEIVYQPGAQHAAPLQRVQCGMGELRALEPGSLSAVVRSFKAAVTKRAREELSWRSEIWQRNYFERIVRDGQEFSDAARYIAENPEKWKWDSENLNGSEPLSKPKQAQWVGT